MADGQVIRNVEVAPDHFRLTLRLSSSFATPYPGHFVMIRESDHREPLLPRPLSVYGFHREGGYAVLDLLYRVVGRGTSLFSRLRSMSSLTVLGPLGRGFTVDRDVRKVILVAGGVGVAPLTFLLHESYSRTNASGKTQTTAYVGARTAELLTGLDRLDGFCDIRVATNDGSAGHQGLVTDLLRCNMDGYAPEETLIYGCGPAAMIRSLGLLVRKTAIPCQVSLEERMACGIGACLGCAVAITDSKGKSDYQRVCHDGPVFNIREISQISSLDE
jgi:dihydroorotate dehydrogenase electron transfer subunit